MKFQNISIHSSKVMLGTRKRDEQTNELRDKPEAIWLPTFCGHNSDKKKKKKKSPIFSSGIHI